MGNVSVLKVAAQDAADDVQVDAPPVGGVELAGDALRARVRGWMDTRKAAQAAVASEIGMSNGVVSSWFKGAYTGDVPALEGRLRRWVYQQESKHKAIQATVSIPDWVGTPSAGKALAVLKYAHSQGEIGLIYGGAGLGKTTAVRHYRSQRNNIWVATMTPAHAGLVSALKGIAAAVGVEATGGAEAIYRVIVEKVDKSGGCLVIDEAQHLDVKALEQIRALNDETGLGIAFVGNERVYAQINDGRRAVYLAQLRSRIGKQVRLANAQPGDVKALMGACKVNAGCEKELQGIAAKPGALRGVVKALKLASVMAAEAGRAVDAADVKSAWGELGGVG